MNADHQRLMESQQQTIQKSYHAAVADGTVEPIILILDMKDGGARQLATAQVGSDEVSAMIEACGKQGKGGIAVLALAASDARHVFGTTSQGAIRLLDAELQPGFARFGIFSGGTISWGTFHIGPSEGPPLGVEALN